MFETTTTVRVRYAETDQMGVVYHGNFAQYFEVGRAESIRKLGYTYKDMEQSGLLMPVVDLQMKFIRPATYDELLTIKTTVKELPMGHKIVFHHEIFNEKGEIACVGNICLYFLDAATKQKSSPPPALIEILKGYFN